MSICHTLQRAVCATAGVWTRGMYVEKCSCDHGPACLRAGLAELVSDRSDDEWDRTCHLHFGTHNSIRPAATAVGHSSPHALPQQRHVQYAHRHKERTHPMYCYVAHIHFSYTPEKHTNYRACVSASNSNCSNYH